MAQDNHSSPQGHAAFTFAWKFVGRGPSGSVAALALQDLGGGRLRVRRIIGVALSACWCSRMLGVGAWTDSRQPAIELTGARIIGLRLRSAARA